MLLHRPPSDDWLTETGGGGDLSLLKTKVTTTHVSLADHSKHHVHFALITRPLEYGQLARQRNPCEAMTTTTTSDTMDESQSQIFNGSRVEVS